MSYTKTNWENLPSTNTPVYDVNLIKIENELDTLDKNTIYSTTEQRIGTWIDGKSLYRKVITGTTPNQQQGYSSIPLTYETLVSYRLKVKSSYGFDINNNYSEAGTVQLSAAIKQNQVYFGTLVSNYYQTPFLLIIEYTKTTD